MVIQGVLDFFNKPPANVTGLFRLRGFKFRGVCVTPNFQRPLAAKLYVGYEDVLAVQE